MAVQPGDPLKIKADEWNRLLALAEGTQPGAYEFRDSTGTYQRRGPEPVGQTAQIVEIEDDYLKCQTYDEVTEDATVTLYVAKPWMLRRDPFDGETIVFPNGQSITYTYVDDRERDADDGSTNETQVMTPGYYVGEVIDVFRKRTNVIDENDDHCRWQDRNTCGRFWALEA